LITQSASYTGQAPGRPPKSARMGAVLDDTRLSAAGLPDGAAAAKADWRRRLQAQRALASPAERRRRDRQRTSRVVAAAAALRPAVVACYAAAGAEPGTAELVAALAAGGAAVLLPVLSPLDGRRRGPDWARWAGPDHLRPAWRGVLEPTTPPLGAAALAQADLVILPGLAGSPAGVRLGTGGGWYDRALRHGRPAAPRWLLLDAGEVVPGLPAEPWDEPVDALVTDTEWVVCRQRAWD
jgi:5-formyltetrahydrofolate cyclo-ligase